MSIRITLDQLPDALRERMASDTEQMRRAKLLGVGHKVASFAVERGTDLGLDDLGGYRQGWEARATARGVEVLNSAPYSAVIEFGRRPRRPGPPLEPILAWVRRKLRPEVRRRLKERQGGKRVQGLEAEMLRVAKRIRWSLHVKGMKGRFVLRDSLAKVGILIQDAGRELQR